MKKVGLVCNYYMLNYGSLLQCYATQKAIENMGHDVEAIQFENIPTDKAKKQLFLRLKLKQMFKPKAVLKKLERMKNTNSNQFYNDLRTIRKNRFHDFIDEKLCLSKPYDSLEQVQGNVGNYDVIALGSDQLLCPKDIIFGYHTLEFVPEDIKKISYAASFGLSKLPGSVVKKARRDLKRFDDFAAREVAGAGIYKELTGKEVPVVVDPTLLLESEQWKEVAGKTPIIEGDYIFCYFIGDNSEHRKMAEALKKKKGLKIVTIRHIDDYIEADENFGDIAVNDAGPKEFINMIVNAKYVLSDSFHATIFSTMMHKQFCVFNRFAVGSKGSTNSRLDSLLGKLGTEERRVSESKEMLEIIDNQVDWNRVDNILKTWIEESKDYLKKAIEE